MFRVITFIFLIAITTFADVDFESLKAKASTGDAEAQYELGTAFLKGDGAEKNLKTAVEWIHKAADQDYGPAVVSMVYRYEKGEGVEQNLDEATRWYEKALELGYTRDLKKQEELKDHAANFANWDAGLRRLPDSPGEHYAQWVVAAVDAKKELRRMEEIDPWLESLSTEFPENWKILRAVAMGYQHAADLSSYWKYGGNSKSGLEIDTVELNRWRALKLMKKAHALAEAESATEAEMASLTLDYLTILWSERAEDDHERLQLLSTDLAEEQLAELDDRTFESEPVFHARPDSPTAARSDGELIMALLGKYDLKLLLKEAQIPLTKAEHLMQACYSRGWSQADGELFQEIADDEFWVWTNGVPWFAKLPEDYDYIPQLTALLEKNPETGSMLGRVFESRGQLERAATAYEQAGETNAVRSIRANQGSFAPCDPLPTGVPVELEYHYRNGDQVAVDLFRVKVETNLLERFKSESVEQCELDLLQGDPDRFREAGGFADTNRIEKVQSLTIALNPPPDHRDATERINFGPLEAGVYFVRAKMRDGNTAETSLNVRDTMLYFAPTPSATTNNHVLFILCDARTGKPRPNETITFLETEERLLRDEKGKHFIGRFREDGVTDVNGCYVLKGRKLSFPYREFHALANLQGFPIIINSYSGHLEAEQDPINQAPFVATDRPIYRPGDTAHLMVWQAAETNSLQAEIHNGDFELPLLGDPSLRPNRFGVMNAMFKIPEEARLGRYRVDQEDGYPWGGFQIEQYRAPTFEVAIQQLEDGRIEISADYAYGAPVDGGKLSGFVEFHEKVPSPWYPTAPFDRLWGGGYWWNGRQFFTPENANTEYHHSALIDKPLHLELDADGRAIIDIKTFADGGKALATTGWFSVFAKVMDAANKEYSADAHFPNNMKQEPPCCWMDKTFFQPSENITAHAVAEKGGELSRRYERVEGTNTVAISATENFSSGLYQVRARDAAGGESEPFQFFVLGDADNGLTANNPIRVVVEKGVYDADETATILIQVDRPGRHVYFFDQLFGWNAYSVPWVFVMDETSKRIELPIHGDAGKWECAAMTVVDGKHHLKTGRIHAVDPAKKTGRVKIEPDKNQYQPGATVKVNLRALNDAGEGERCAIALTVYNKTLDRLVDHLPTHTLFETLFSTWLNAEIDYLYVDSSWPRSASPTAPKWVMKRRGLTPPKVQTFGGTEDLFGDGASWEAPSAEELGGAPDAPVHLRENLADHAYWNAFVETDEHGEATVKFPLPETLTEWKVMAWAVHTNFAASGETSFKCAKELVVQLNTPRFMVECDELEISASVRNHTTNTLAVVARSSLSMLSTIVKALEPGAEKLLYWTHTARNPGTETVKVTASAQGVGDGVSKPLPILPHSMLKRGGDSGILTKKKNPARIEIKIPEAVEPESLVLDLNASPNMLETVAGALPFLAEYPHGCTEQTLNKFLPSIVVLQTLETLGLELDDLAAAMPPERTAVYNRDEILKRAQVGITQLEQAQRWDGDWSWNLETSSDHADPLVTAWIVRGLAAASEHNELKIQARSPSQCLRHMVFQLKTATAPPWQRKTDEPLTHTDVLTAVVLQEVGPENWLTNDRALKISHELMPTIGPFLMKHAGELSLYGKTLLAYFFELRGETAPRDELITYIEQYLENDPNLGTYWLRVKTDQYWLWQNDEIEIMAWYLKLLNRVEPNSAKTAGVARWLLINRQHGDHWKSTRDTAICVEALCEYIVNNPTAAQNGAVGATLNGKPIEQGLKPGLNTLELTSTSEHPTFFDVAWRFQTLENPIVAEQCELVKVSRAYYRIDQEHEERTPLTETDVLKAGETIEVELSFEAPQELEYLLATDFKPAGFECLETQSGYRHGGLRHYQEIHDERVACYINKLPKGTSNIRYRLRPEHAGRVSALPATIELMYAPQKAANSAESKLLIER